MVQMTAVRSIAYALITELRERHPDLNIIPNSYPGGEPRIVIQVIGAMYYRIAELAVRDGHVVNIGIGVRNFDLADPHSLDDIFQYVRICLANFKLSMGDTV